ncbi:MAG: hypothetical protein HYX72_08310 [Acidobacteria bacterium]|nr:hypothetical protein [Acidobacteriota bacterium]
MSIKSLVWLALFLLFPGSALLIAQQKTERLYHQMGGYDGIAVVVDELVAGSKADIVGTSGGAAPHH